MWTTCEIERCTEQKLIEELGSAQGSAQFGEYTTARKHLLEEVLDEIKAIQPELTDHGARHVMNVLKNIACLLGEDKRDFSGIELYCMLLAAIFHDVGNFFCRQEHQRHVASVYDYVRSGGRQNKQEKGIVLKIAEAHCGEAPDGTRDTLKSVEEISHMHGQRVRLRKIAALIRFADELAEGPQRTSLLRRTIGGYGPESEIHHKYAEVVEVFIDRGNGRIAVTFHVDVLSNAGVFDEIRESELRDFLNYIYRRIEKLNQERQYARYYCDFLNPFKKTTVSFNFWQGGIPLDLDLPTVDIEDIVVPGDEGKKFMDHDSSYMPDEVIQKIRRRMAG